MTSHLDADLVAAFLDGNLSEVERDSVEAHLYECDECCEEVAVLDDALHIMPRARQARRYVVPGIAAAAILAVVLVARPWREVLPTPGGEPAVIERAAPDLDRTRIEALSPDQGALLDPGGIDLQWRSAGEGARYQVTVTTTEGDSVWISVVTDTVAPVPTGVIEHDREYLWYVDALLPDGETASTGISHFRTGP